MPRQTNKIFYIYKIHFLCGFPAGRYYIGKRTYYGNNINNDPYTGSGIFCKSYFKKYGAISGITYIKEILEINPSNVINLEREKVIIRNLWETDKLCMNMMQGGIGSANRKGHIQTPEEIARRVESFKKSKPTHKKHPKLTEETKKKISKALIGNKNGVGNVTSDEVKQKLKDVLGKEVYQYDLNGNFIKKYASLHDAAKSVDGYPINISNCCNNKPGWYSYKKYMWSFTETSKVEKYIDRSNKPIQQLDLLGNVINTFDSVKSASIKTGISASSISSLAKGNRARKTAGGFKWKYVENE